MFILEILFGLKSKQGNVLCTFLHGELEPGENVYVEMPLGFSRHSKDGTRKVLKLKKTLYGLCQSFQAFWKYITEKLKACGLEQSKYDPCLCVGTKVICVVYVDDIIFWSKYTEDIKSSAMQLCELAVDLEQEDNAAGFLGVTLEQDPETGLLEMKQTGLIKQVIKALGLDDASEVVLCPISYCRDVFSTYLGKILDFVVVHWSFCFVSHVSRLIVEFI
jgi:hypothetical protein